MLAKNFTPPLPLTLNISIKKLILLCQICPIAFLVFGCTNNSNIEPPTQPNVTATVQSSQVQIPNEILTFVAVPAAQKSIQESTLKKMVQYLEQKLQRQIQWQVAKDYDMAIDMLVNGQAQIGILGPFSYVKAKQRNSKIEPIAAAIYQETNRPWYTSVIIASPTSNIRTLSDLSGTRFGFVSKSSTSGFLVPSYAFKTNQIDPEKDFATIIYSGNHDQAIADLVAGKVDAVSVEESAISRAKKTGLLTDTNYVKIWESEPIPESPMVISDKFPPELVTTLKSAIINSQGLTNDSGITSLGYTTITDQDYELVRKIQKVVAPPTK